MIRTLKSLFRNKAGVTAIEYGVLAALIIVAAVTAIGLVGGQLNTTFGTIQTALTP